MIDLYTAGTPNGLKAVVTLKELGLAYTPHFIDLANLEQKQAWFLAINPNGRIPAIVDRDSDDFAVFESGAIMWYLAEHPKRTVDLLPTDAKQRNIVMQWLMFQIGGLGPMMGQSNVFRHYFPEQIPSVQARYQNESLRLLSVLDSRLREHEYLVGDYGLADIAHFCWARGHEHSGVDITGLVHLQRWLNQIEVRPAVQRALAVKPTPISADESVTPAKKY